MPPYKTSPEHEHDRPERLGVLLVNLGTPDAPTPGAVRRYLAQFLADPRVVETPRWLWRLILHGYVLRVRPRRSAAAYRRIWTEDGSPMLLYSARLAAAVERCLAPRLRGEVIVALGMSYGSPAIDSAVETLVGRHARRIVVLPLYPQYAGSTTGSVFDAVTRSLSRWRRVPAMRFIDDYHDAPGYIDAVASSIREFRERHGRGERLLFSFHGLPRAMVERGDPYRDQCLETARLVARSLALGEDDWQVAFQSRVGRAEWLRPYCDETLVQLGKQGLGKIDVVCPGFAVDCLETLEEIAMQNAECYAAAGGGELRYIPALNASERHVGFLSDLLEQNLGGWLDAPVEGTLDTAPNAGPGEQRAHGAGAGH